MSTLNNLINRGLSGNTHDLIALLYEIKKNEFIVTPNKQIYMYTSGIWKNISFKSYHIIKKTIFSELLSIYMNYLDNNTDYNKIKLCRKVIYKLKINSFRNNLFNEFCIKFLDKDFDNKLFNHNKLLCFGEDLFDLEACEWRKTRYDDYCFVKAGVTKDEVNDSNIELLNKILSDLFPREEIKNELLNNISSNLLDDKHSPLLFNGNGGNGKSFFCKLMNKSFGEYFVHVPLKIFNDKYINDYHNELLHSKFVNVINNYFDTDDINNLIKYNYTFKKLYNVNVNFARKWTSIICTNNWNDFEYIEKQNIRYFPFETRFTHNPVSNNEKQINILYMHDQFHDKIKGSFIWLLLKPYRRKKYIQDKQKINYFLQLGNLDGKSIFHILPKDIIYVIIDLFKY